MDSQLNGNQIFGTLSEGSVRLSNKEFKEGERIKYKEPIKLDKKINGYEQKSSDISSCNVSVLDEIRIKNINRLVIGNLNINSLSSKFDQLKVLIQEKINILTITEAKLDSNVSLEHFVISAYAKSYRLVFIIQNWGGVIIHIKEPIPSKELRLNINLNMPENIESIFVEINLFKAKWLVCGCYHPPSQDDHFTFSII